MFGREDINRLIKKKRLTLMSAFLVPRGGLLRAVWTAEAYLFDRMH